MASVDHKLLRVRHQATNDLIRSSSLVGYVGLVTELGGDAHQLLVRSCIEPWALDNEESMISYRSIIRLMEATARELDCPDFGLRLAMRQGLDVLGPIAVIACNSPTVGEAFAAIVDHLNFYSPVCVSRIDDTSLPGFSTLSFDITVQDEPNRRQTIELAIGIVVRDLQILTGGKYTATRVLFRHSSPLRRSVYRKHLGTQVLFAQENNAVVIRREVMQQPLCNTNPYLKKVVEKYVTQFVEKYPLHFTDQVALLVSRLLPSQKCDLQHVAQHFSLHERTLQRKLKAEGCPSFGNIVDAVRRDRAGELLLETNLSMNQIATMLGFSDQATLSRACVKWFGQTPSAVRKQRSTAT